MAAPGGKDITFKLYGLDHMGGEVYADLFAKKIEIIVKGLKEVDKIYNGGTRYEYTISGLVFASAGVSLREQLISTKVVKRHPAEELLSYGHDASRAISPRDAGQEVMVEVFNKLCKNSKEKFSYATLKNGTDSLVRIDSFLARQINALRRQLTAEREKQPPKYFAGEAIGSFDGIIEEVDLQGDAPEARLILSAGGQPIECVILGLELPEIRQALGSRVCATGTAIYEGDTGLPSRLEVRKIEHFQSVDISKWKGALRPADIEDWTG